MDSQRNRPSGHHIDLNLEGLIARAQLLGAQGRRTIAELKAIRARVDTSRAEAEGRLLRANAALQGAAERLRVIRAAG
jgi:hypothetical protein